MPTMPILLERSTSTASKPFQELSVKQPAALEAGETPLFQQLVDASPSPTSSTPAPVEQSAETSGTSDQDSALTVGALDDRTDALPLENPHDPEDAEPLEALFAFCSVPPLEPSPTTEPKTKREVKREEINTQQVSKKCSFEIAFAADGLSSVENVEALEIVEAAATVKKLKTEPQDASFLEEIEVLRSAALQTLQEQPLQSLLEKPSLEGQSSLLALAKQTLGPDSEGDLERDQAEMVPTLTSLLIGEGSYKMPYDSDYSSRTNPRAIVNQIADQIPYEALKIEGQQHFKLQIHPKELGEVQVHLVLMEQGKVHATFSGSAYTMDLLQQGANLLCDSLTKEGFDALSENFSFTSDQSFQRGFEREGAVAPTSLTLDHSIQQSVLQSDRLEASIRQLLQHQGSGLNVSLTI
jgi:Flagellar hook-length control protein FliK